MYFIFQILFPRVFAQTTIDATFFRPEEGTPAEADVVGYIRNLYTFALGIGGVIAVVVIIVGGLLIAFSGAIDKKNEGKQMIIRALWGLVLLFGSFLVLNTINPQLTALKPPGVEKGVQVSLSPNLCTLNVDPSLAGKGSCHEKGIANPVGEVKETVTSIDPRTGREVTREVSRQVCQCYIDEQACPREVYDACTPQKVEIPPRRYDLLRGMQYLKNCEKKWVLLEWAGVQGVQPCALANLSEKFKSSFVEHGAIFWRLPLYRGAYDPSYLQIILRSGPGEALQQYINQLVAQKPPLGVETAQCVTVGAASLDQFGQRGDVKKLPFGNEIEKWRKC